MLAGRTRDLWGMSCCNMIFQTSDDGINFLKKYILVRVLRESLLAARTWVKFDCAETEATRAIGRMFLICMTAEELCESLKRISE